MSEENKEEKQMKEEVEAPDKTPAKASIEASAKTTTKASTEESVEVKERPAAPPPARRPAAAADAEPKAPSPKQPVLDKFVELIKKHVAEDAVEEAEINEKNNHLPTVTIKNEYWLKCADFLKNYQDLKLDYLRNLSGVDQETHMEVVYHLYSITNNDNYGVRVKTDREMPTVASVTPIWPTADWNEREVYDLLGIDFPGHPDLRRIMMPDDWIGHPLRKDYVPIDPEV